MLKLNDDIEGARALLESIGYTSDHVEGDKIVDAVIAVLLTLKSCDLSQDALRTVQNLISTRALADLNTLPYDLTGDVWDSEFDYGNDREGSYVRVKPDAYDSPTGSKHNGLVGRVAFIKSGYCSVDYIGFGTGNTMKHALGKLQSLKRSVK